MPEQQPLGAAEAPNNQFQAINGYAPGTYFCFCGQCKQKFMGDKRAVRCPRCAYEIPLQEMAAALATTTLEREEAKKEIRDDVWDLFVGVRLVNQFTDPNMLQQRIRLQLEYLVKKWGLKPFHPHKYDPELVAEHEKYYPSLPPKEDSISPSLPLL